jgi:hypothetical protein
VLFRNKLADRFAEEAEDLRQQLEVEKARRISAEIIAEERKAQIQSLQSRLDKAESQRDAAVAAHFKSLEKAVEPTEVIPAKIDKDKMRDMFKPKVSPWRKMDRADILSVIQRNHPKSA